MNKSLLIAISFFLVGVIFSQALFSLGDYSRSSHYMYESTHSDLDEGRDHFLTIRDELIGEMINQEDYACCLDKPCTYCIEKTPGHGEGPTCRCLDDVVEGRNPCGECIGEILEGHGNRFLAKYFASAIAEEVGEDYTDTLKEIISDKYDISVEEQI